MEVAAPEQSELESREKFSRVHTTLLVNRRIESIFERLKVTVLERSDTLPDSLVQNIHTVSATVSARNSSGLTVKTHTKSAEVAE